MSNEVYNYNFPKCPYCGHEEVDEVYELFSGYDIENEANIECGECEKTYLCRGHITHSFTSETTGADDAE